MQQNSTNKAITISFMLAGVLVGIFVSVLIETIAAVTTGGVSAFFMNDFVRHGLPVLIGLILFIFLQTNKPIHAWGDEVITELSRVIWPSRKDTTAMTVVVCVMVLASGAFFFVLDTVSGAVVNWLLHLNLGI